MLDVIGSSFTQGAVWAVMAIGVYITYRLLDIADLSAEGTFPLGGAIAAVLITHPEIQMNPALATLMAFLGGMLAGLLAGWIHTKLHIPPLITGILVQTGLYSINYRIMLGRANISLLGSDTIYSGIESWLDLSKNQSVAIVALIILAVVIGLLVFFLHTEIGLGLRATGDNQRMSQANGINTNWMITLGYMLSNGLVALSGAMVAQKDGFADLSMGIGTIVIGLASIILVEVIIPNLSIGQRLMTILLGSFMYRLVIDFILYQRVIEIRATDLRLFSAILLGFILFYPEIQRYFQGRFGNNVKEAN